MDDQELLHSLNSLLDTQSRHISPRNQYGTCRSLLVICKMICTAEAKKETRPWHCYDIYTVKTNISANFTSSSLHSLGFGGTFGFAAGDGNGMDGTHGFFGLDMAGLGVLGRGLLMGGSCGLLVRLSFNLVENNNFSKNYTLVSALSPMLVQKPLMWLQHRSNGPEHSWTWYWDLCASRS